MKTDLNPDLAHEKVLVNCNTMIFFFWAKICNYALLDSVTVYFNFH